MANEIANIALNATMTGNKDSGLGTVKDIVSLAGLGMSKTGGKYYHDDGAWVARYDLNDGTLEDAFGDGIAFATLYGLYIKNNTGGEIQIGAADHPLDIFGTSASHLLELKTGCTFLYLNPTGISLGVGSADALKIAGSAGNIDIIIIGSTS